MDVCSLLHSMSRVIQTFIDLCQKRFENIAAYQQYEKCQVCLMILEICCEGRNGYASLHLSTIDVFLLVLSTMNLISIR